MKRHQFDLAVRLFPKAWRDRYGPELQALLEDTYGPHGRVPFWSRASLLRAAVVEHVHGTGLVGKKARSTEAARAGTLAVMWAWAVFVVAGAAFANASEGWSTGPLRGARLAGAGYYLVVAAAMAGAVVVLTASLPFVRPLISSLRASGWRELRRSAVRPVSLTLITVAVLAATVVWARHLTKAQRDGAYWPYEVIFLVLAVAASTTIASWTALATTWLRRLDVSPGTWQVAGKLAMAACASMLVMAGGAGLWWAAVASEAPAVVGSPPVGSPMLDCAGVLMVAGLALALVGATRAVRGSRLDPQA